MSVHILLNKLNKVKKTGNDKWVACCPAHNGTKQSLAIRDDNGKVLIHCFAEGCAIMDILGAVGLSLDDIQPKLAGEFKSQKRPFYAGDILEISRDEMMVAYMICKKMLDATVNANDMERLLKCTSRLAHATEQANGLAPLPKYKAINHA